MGDWLNASATLDSIGDGVLSVDLSDVVTALNPSAESMTGWTWREAIGCPARSVLRIVDRDTRKPVPDPLRLAMASGQSVRLTPNSLLLQRGGGEVAIEDSTSPIRDGTGQVVGAVIVFRDVGNALETSRRMSRVAHHDALTGLPNRLLLIDRLTTAVALCHRRETPLAVCVLDLDGFKGLNDSLGHLAGDQFLVALAGRLGGALRQSDTVSRYGGDEFVIVLGEIEHRNDAVLVAEKLLKAAAAPCGVGVHETAVTASLGVAIYPDDGLDAVALVAAADAAMYVAKRAGGGVYRFFRPCMP